MHQFSLFDPQNRDNWRRLRWVINFLFFFFLLPCFINLPHWTAITGEGIVVLWKVWWFTLEKLLFFFCTKKELAEAWRTGCQCQSYFRTFLCAYHIMLYASSPSQCTMLSTIVSFIWKISILSNDLEIIYSKTTHNAQRTIFKNHPIDQYWWG